MMEDLVEKLLNSGNKVLEAAGKDFNKWSKLKHNKEDLELFLQFNLAHIRYRPAGVVVMKDIVCTSNTTFINTFSKIKETDKKKAVRSKNSGIRTKDKKSVMTYNLLENKYYTLPLDLWEIVTFLTISPENIEVLDQVVNDMLKKPIQKDLSENTKKLDDKKKAR